MPKLNLGRVVGRDGGFGNIETVYLNDGGSPRVTVDASGEDSAKDFRFTFANLVRDVATADEIERIAAGEPVQSSNVVTAGVMSGIWAKIRAAFAPKKHEHDASDITTGQLAAALLANGIITEEMLSDGCVNAGKLADGSVGISHLDEEMAAGWESLSQPDSWQPIDAQKSPVYWWVKADTKELVLCSDKAGTGLGAIGRVKLS